MGRWLRERAGVWHVVAALAIFSLYSVIFLRYGPPHALAERFGPSLEAAFAYTPSEAHAFLGHLGDDGRALFARSLWSDLPYPLIYAPALALIIALSIWKALRAWKVAYALGGIVLFGGLADWVENAMLLTLIHSFPEPRPTVALIASIATSTKLVIVLLALALVPVTVTFWFLRWASERGRAASGSPRP